MGRLPRVLWVLAAVACGGEVSDNIQATVGWTFNYRDWTVEHCPEGGTNCQDDDLRECGNAGSGQLASRPYLPVARVAVNLEDPLDQLRPYHGEVPCSRGALDVRGLVNGAYTLTVTATSEDGTALYEGIVPDYAIGEFREDSVALRTVVGELYFTTLFPGDSPFTCPNDAATLRHTFVQGDIEVTGERACATDPYPYQNLPYAALPTATGKYLPIDYTITIEALASMGDVTYCGAETRAVSPGASNKSANNDFPLTAGACP